MSSPQAMKIALVTGANQGIGYEIVKSLVKNYPNVKALLGCRDISKGEEAVKKLISEDKLNPNQIESIQIDLDDAKSISSAAKAIESKYKNLDILVNNAGFAFKGSRFDGEVCRLSTKTNYYGTRLVIEAMLPLLHPNSRVVNVSSAVSRVSLNKMSENNRNRFLNPNLTIQQLDALMEEFFESVEKGDYKSNGWPESGYGMSKVALSMYTRILARDIKEPKGIVFNACCPGYCNTSMSSHRGTRSPSVGAETPVLLATLPESANTPNGEFWEDSKPSRWV